MDFVKSFFSKNEPLTSFFPDQHRSGKKRGTKVFNWSEVHFYRSTSKKIHTLVFRVQTKEAFMSEDNVDGMQQVKT